MTKQDKEEFVKAYSEKIDQLANQDKVRNALITQELNDGTLDTSMQNTVAMGWAMYQYALNVGFGEDKSFDIALRHMFGSDSHEQA